MVRMPQLTTKGYVGIDIKSTNIVVVQLQYDKNAEKVKLISYGIAKRDTTQTENASKTIKELIKDAKITTTNAVFGLANEETSLNIFELPYHLKENELDRVIQKKAKELFGEKIHDMAIGWSVVAHDIRKDEHLRVIRDESAWKVLFVATPQHDITTLAKIAEKAKLTFIAPEVKALALTRAIATQLHDSDCILHMEEEGTIELITTEHKTLRTITQFSTIEDANDAIEEQQQTMKGSIIFTGAYGSQIFEQGLILAVPRNRMILGNPWKGMLVPRGLEDTLRAIGPTISVACGLAMREIQREHKIS